MKTSDRIMRWPEVRRATGLSRTTAWRMAKAGQFPQNVNISPSMVGWWASEIEEFLNSLKQPEAAV